MIEVIIAGAACVWLAKKGGDAGQSAADGAVRSVKRSARRVADDVAAKAETVLQPCAHGRAPHKRIRTGETYADGETVYACRVCGRSMS